MKSKYAFLVISIMFLVFAVAFSLAIWNDVSLAAKMAFFALGFGSGIAAGRQFLAKR
jgi:uncharacterized protein YebE (UPF0316 family)